MKLILASSSPRRKMLLKETGFRFEVIQPTLKEKRKPKETPKNLVSRLSQEKARQTINQAQAKYPNVPFVVVAADTIVVAPVGRHILGKPKSILSAKRMLAELSGKTHTVFTGYTLWGYFPHSCTTKHKPKRITRVVQTKVTFKNLTSLEIKNYVNTREPMDKAGAYAAQGKGMHLIKKINGSYTNVVGLPLTEVTQDLLNHFSLVPHCKKSNPLVE